MSNFRSNLKSILQKKNLEYAELFLKVLAFLVGGYWTYYIFKYQYEILPETEPTSLILKSNIRQVGKLDNLTFYQVELTIQNKSKSRIKVPASYYNISGANIIPFVNPKRRFAPGSLSKDSTYLNNFFSYDTSKNVIIQTDRILQDDSYISPESEFNVQHSFAIPNKRFEILVVNISSISCKSNADIITKWEFDNVGRIFAYPQIIKKHFFRKNDTTTYDDNRDHPLGAKYDLYFTNISNDYFINRIDSTKH